MDIVPGPCTLCGATAYPLSLGGPGICPSCDCGDFGLTKVKRQSDELARLRAENERLRAALLSIARKGEFPDEHSVYGLASEAERALDEQ